ncbi:hypothetical protein [Shimazuella alba]|uniref:Replicative DNA helicase n=1 Tax=Shimazuella alba TaxID=2690964 RepID=A0A6I4VYG4_9BACL|nr:hypothetical protein [Shimazuella alba]MXQ54970.1 hypothetical protein [Shimazuella alba]
MFNEIFHGFSNRMNSLLVIQPILDLEKKERYKQYPLVSIGVSILLFILENMLRNSDRNTYEDIARFLQVLLRDRWNEELSFEESLEMTKVIVREYLRNNGQPFQISYYDFEQKQQKTKYYHLIDFSDNYTLKDIKRNASFRLTPDAIESLFKTREIFQEMQISIMQMYFRQQIQRKVFDGALQTTEELIFSINNEKIKMKQLIERIVKDVLQIAKENEFEAMLVRYEKRMEQEKRQFDEISNLITHTISEYHKEMFAQKEDRAFELIKKVQRNWWEAKDCHAELFTLKQDVQKFFIDSMESIIFQSFQSNINFETEVIPLVMEKKLQLKDLRTILQPLNPLRSMRLFHPSIFFETHKRRQTQIREEKTLNELTDVEKIRIEQEEREQKHQRLNLIKDMISFLFSPLHTKEYYQMSKYLNQNQPEWLTNPLFANTLIQLHQYKNISLELIDSVNLLSLDDIHRAIGEYVIESRIDQVTKCAHLEILLDEVIIISNGSKEISDFYVKRGEKK